MEEAVEKRDDGTFVLRVVQCRHCIMRAYHYISPAETKTVEQVNEVDDQDKTDEVVV